MDNNNEPVGRVTVKLNKVRGKRLGSVGARLLALAGFLTLGGCGVVQHVIFKTTGDVLSLYAEKHQVPYVMGTDDLAMNCSMSEALTPLLMSFSRVTSTPNQLAVIVYSSAGICAETQAWDEELRYLRAVKKGNATEAQDAQITQKRYQVLAANRNYTSYLHLVEEFGEPGGECPDLDGEFENFVWMMGMIGGLQALSNEVSSGVGLGVPKNLIAKAERGAACLDDDEFWGVPMAMRAMIWTMLPGIMPQGEDPYARLRMASEKGEKAGVRLPHLLHAMAVMNQGDTEALKEVIRQHAKSKSIKPANPERKLLDAIATNALLGISDRLWTEATGHRTPTGGLGTFWDDKKANTGEVMSLDDIL